MATSTTTDILEARARATEARAVAVAARAAATAAEAWAAAAEARAAAEEGRAAAAEEVVVAPVVDLLVEDVDVAPDAASYRLPAAAIRQGVCMARAMGPADADRRWSIAIYREHQCGEEVAVGSDLCSACRRRQAAYAASPRAGVWVGLITEEPLPWMHMLGTAWAERMIAEGKLKWNGDSAIGGSSPVLTAPAGCRIRYRRQEERIGVWTGTQLELDGERISSPTCLAQLLRGVNRPINGWDVLQIEVDGVWRPIKDYRAVPAVPRPRGAAAGAAAEEE
jgi:hypothetical protein